ncbi:MAG TPA: DUF72 domain-containing protein [Vicinamibacteria bacterium]|nr:DUF72 domain-containing protein [Vicinamibacteria bacterium]
MKLFIGTSGFSYKEWKGRFYPEDLPDAEMLRFYGTRFGAVEINNSFYRMPARTVLLRWAEETPAEFTFVLKAPRRITHERRLGDVAEIVSYFFDTASALGDKRGPVLFQLPPYFQKDLARLQDFLDVLPTGLKPTLEFRHVSWYDDEVKEALRARGAALCHRDSDDPKAPAAALSATADWGYLRLRRVDYQDDDLRRWADLIRAQPWNEAYVFFKHEEEGRGPDLAQRFKGLLSSAS